MPACWCFRPDQSPGTRVNSDRQPGGGSHRTAWTVGDHQPGFSLTLRGHSPDRSRKPHHLLQPSTRIIPENRHEAACPSPCQTLLLDRPVSSAQRLCLHPLQRRGAHESGPTQEKSCWSWFPPRTTPSDALPKTSSLPTSCPPTSASAAHGLGVDQPACRPATRERMSADGSIRSLLLRIAGIEKRTIQYPPTPISTGDPWMWAGPMHGDRSPLGCALLMPLDASQPRLVEVLAVSVEASSSACPMACSCGEASATPSPKAARRRPLEDIAATRDPEAGRTQLAAQKSRRAPPMRGHLRDNIIARSTASAHTGPPPLLGALALGTTGNCRCFTRLSTERADTSSSPARKQLRFATDAPPQPRSPPQYLEPHLYSLWAWKTNHTTPSRVSPCPSRAATPQVQTLPCRPAPSFPGSTAARASSCLERQLSTQTPSAKLPAGAFMESDEAVAVDDAGTAAARSGGSWNRFPDNGFRHGGSGARACQSWRCSPQSRRRQLARCAGPALLGTSALGTWLSRPSLPHIRTAAAL